MIIFKWMNIVIIFSWFSCDLAGGEYILGAFFAGMLVRHAQFSPKVVESLSRIIYGIFAPLFFIVAGTRIDIFAFFSDFSNLWLVIIFFFAYLIVEAPILLLLKWYNLGTVLPTMVLIACTIIVPIAAGHIGLSHNLFDETFPSDDSRRHIGVYPGDDSFHYRVSFRAL